MKPITGRIISFNRSALLVLLIFTSAFCANAQSFSPTNVYSGWSTSTLMFATVPAAPGLTFSQFSRGSGLTVPSPVTSGITSSGWDGPTSEAAAASANNFFLFSITANASTSFSVSGILFSLQRSGTGPSSFQVQSSVNGGPFAAFGSPFSTSVNGTFVQLVTPAAALAVPTGGDVVFRLVGWNSSNPAGTFRINNNTAINGTYTGAVPVLTTTTVTGAPFCASSTSGAAGTVSFSATGSFSAGNVFTAELSDAAGSFASPVTIGTLTSTSSAGTINTIMPAGTTAGTAYRIRVVASNPAVTGSDNGADLSVVQGIGFTHTSTDITCNGASDGSVTTSISEGVAPYTYAWSNSATTASISGLSQGTYSLTITAANGCTGTLSAVAIAEPAVLTAGATGTDVSCNSGTNGAATLSVAGGTAPYTYAWSNSATTADLLNVGAGTYSVLITDNNGCTQSASVTITEPTALIATHTTTDVMCNAGSGGAVNLTVSGGTGPYTYAWNNSATTEDISGLGAGTYSVIITDNNSCTQTVSAMITEPNAIVATPTVTDVACNSGTNGAVNLAVNGGTGPYTYNWSNTATTQNISNVTAGSYSVLVTDNNGCTHIESVTVTQPAAITATGTATDVLCNGGTNGSVSLSVSGGTSPFTFAWSNSATTQNLSGIGAGTYSVIVTDNNGCTHTASAAVTEPNAITATDTTTDVLCNGGANGGVNLSVSGGTSPFTYAWSNGATTQNISGVTAGTYSVIVTDNNGCTHTASATVTQPNPITATGSATDVLCNGGSNGSVNLTVSGGTSPFTYAWSNGATTQNISSIVAGTYSVIVTDNNGCTQTASATVAQPNVITATASATDVLCNNGTDGNVALGVNGGVSPYTFAWSNGATTQNLTGVAAGTYSVVVTDNNGCTQTSSAAVSAPSALTTTLDSTDASCGTCANGGADLTVNGGTAPYTYMWSNSAATEDLVNVLPGTYTVVITDSNGCQYTDTVTVNFSTDVPPANTTTNINVYPNPSTGENIFIQLTQTQSSAPALFTVYDVTGNAVYTEMLIAGNTQGLYNVSVPLAAGVYTFTIEQNGAAYNGQLILVK